MRTAASSDIQLDRRRVVSQLRELAFRGLGRMYLPEERLFAFRLRRTHSGNRLEGVSRRYTAIALIGLLGESQSTASRVLPHHSPRELCGRLLDDLEIMDDLGEVALTLWAARAVGHPKADKALARLRAMQPARQSYPTVEVAWSLTALSVQGEGPADPRLARAIAERLVASFPPRSGLFPHWPCGARTPRLRAHISCFADLVYPIQALSHYHRTTGSPEAIEAARLCARRMCQLQGADGQWWWHYDVRTGRLLERYPVYSVHQDSMAPMALLALRGAGGQDHGEAIDRGLAWLNRAPEIAGSLVDAQAGLIWRKVARHEPDKLVRSLQALASSVHPSLRAPGVGRVFRPGCVDYETRPYHMGWILHAWSARGAGEAAAAGS